MDAQLRIIRQTGRLDEMVELYRRGLDLEVLGPAEGDGAEEGVLLGRPGLGYHLELVARRAPSPATPEQAEPLVLTFAGRHAWEAACQRLRQAGFTPLDGEDRSQPEASFTDPEGYRVRLLVHGVPGPVREAGEALPMDRAGGPAPLPCGYRVMLLGGGRMSFVDRERGESREIEWPLRRALKALALLAVSPGLEVPRDDLIEALWPEADEARIERNFHPTLSHLRRSLAAPWRAVRGEEAPNPILYADRAYRLNPKIHWEVDTRELARALETGRRLAQAGQREAAVERLELGRGLYRGPFLEGAYDAWVMSHRERCQQLYLDLLRELGNLLSEMEQLTEAVDAYRQVLIEDPLQERVHVSLMRLYARQGRRDLVRRQYDRLTDLLAEELGVEPLAQATEEYVRLMG